MLLVGGDSYGFENPKYPHWTSIISNNVTNCSVRGRAIDFTSFATMQELYKGNYTHCIFHITNFNRVSVQTDLDILTKVSSTLKYPNEIYDTSTLNKESPFDTYSCNRLVLEDSEIEFYKYGAMGKTLETDKSIHKKHIQMLPKFDYYHSKLAHLTLLKNYCAMNNIKLVFCTPFNDRVWRKHLAEFLDIDLYEFADVPDCNPQDLMHLHEHQTRVSHFSEEEHQKIAKYFLENRKDWIN